MVRCKQKLGMRFDRLFSTVWLSSAIRKWSSDSGSTFSENTGSLHMFLGDTSPGLLVCGTSQRGKGNDQQFVWLFLLCLIELAWDLTNDEWDFLRYFEQSRTPAELENTPRRSSRLVAIRSAIKRPQSYSLFRPPSRLDQTFTLKYRWQRKCSVYRGKMDFFVWHPLEKRPVLESLSVLMLLPRIPDNRRAFIIASSNALFLRLQRMFELPGPCSRGLLSTEAQLYLLILAICETMLADVLICIAEAQQESERIVSRIYCSKHRTSMHNMLT